MSLTHTSVFTFNLQLGLQIFIIELSAAFWAFDRTVRLLGRVVMSISWRYADGSGATRKAELTTYSDGAYTRMRIQVPASRLLLSTASPSPRLTSFFDLEDDTKPARRRLASPDNSLLNLVRIGAGDDIRITIPRLQWVGEHPFSVFAVGRCKSGDPNMGYVDLIIQRQTGLTQKLAALAEKLETSKEEVEGHDNVHFRRASRSKGKRVKVVIDGPFGRSPSLEGARHAVLVAGGIAITFCYPLFVKAARGAFASLESCKLIWIVRDEGILDVLRESLFEVLQELKSRGGSRCVLSIDIYVTSKSKAHSAAQTIVTTGDRRLPSRLKPTWNSTSHQDPYAPIASSVTPSSSVTLFHEKGERFANSPTLSATTSQVWESKKPSPAVELTMLSPYQESSPQPPTPALRQSNVHGSIHSSGSSTFGHASAETLYDGMECRELPPSKALSPMCEIRQEEIHRRLLSLQDVLLESRGGVIEIRRFQGRPSSMSSLHDHVQKGGSDIGGRIMFATCGPAALCDSVRSEVVKLLKAGVDAALVEDCFNW